MRTIARKLARLHDHLGLWGGLLYAVDRIAARLRLPLRVRSYFVVSQPVPAENVVSRRRGGDFTFREIGSDDPALDQMPLETETLDFRFEQGARCFGLFRDSHLLAYLWIQIGSFEEDEVRCCFIPQPADRTSWDFDVYVDPGSRLSPAFASLWEATNGWLRDRGVRHSLSRISAFNSASLRSHKRLGAQVLGRTDFVTVGPVQVLISTLRPRLHLSLRRRSRPRIIIQVPDGPARDALSPVGVRRHRVVE